MIVERQNNEILIRFKAGTKTDKIQAVIDYLRYEELTYNTTANDDDISNLVNESKKGRWKRIEKELGLED